MVEGHPYFEQVARQRGFLSDELMKQIAEVGSVRHLDGVPPDVQQVFATAHDITPEWHVKLQAAFQKSTDNAVSKTVNFPNEATSDDVENVYLLAFRSGCKGVTIYRDGSREEQVLNVGQSKKERDPAAGGIATTRPSRPQLLSGETQRMDTGCGKLFVIMNDDEYGPGEVFANMGKAGGCAWSTTEALGRHNAHDRRYVAGAAAAAAGVSQTQLSFAQVAQGACPYCGGDMRHEGGCAVCN